MTNFESLPTSIIKHIISLSEPKSFYCWSLVSRKLAQICRSEDLFSLIRSRLTVVRKLFHISLSSIAVITKCGDESVLELYAAMSDYPTGDYRLINRRSTKRIDRFTGHKSCEDLLAKSVDKSTGSQTLFESSLTKKRKHHGTSIIYCFKSRSYKPNESELQGKYRLSPDRLASLYKINILSTMESYDMGIPHGWWSNSRTDYKILFDHNIPVAYRGQYSTIDIVNGKANVIYEREYHHRTEHIIIHQNKIVYMHVKLGQIFEYSMNEEDSDYKVVLKQFKVWLANHNAIPVKVDMVNEPYIKVDLSHLGNKISDSQKRRFRNVNEKYKYNKKYGWTELAKCN